MNREVRHVLRPETRDTPEFSLAYVRSGPRGGPTVVVIPGGPGLASIRPYRAVRRLAAHAGLDTIMVEHRGIGLSRCDARGRPLPPSAMRSRAVVGDLAAVLDAEQVGETIVAGSSYGSYLAASFGAEHGARVRGMLLDSALLSADDLMLERAHLRETLWHDPGPRGRWIQELAGHVSATQLVTVTRAAFELGGDELLSAVAQARLASSRSLVWHLLRRISARDRSIAHLRGRFEFDLAGVIGFRELGYGIPTDGRPFDTSLTYADLAGEFPAFAGSPYDLDAAVSRFAWPLVTLSGSRDLRTPAFRARAFAGSAPHGIHVDIDNGHSALDTHPVAFVGAVRALATGRPDTLPALASRLEQTPRLGWGGRLPALLLRLARLERRGHGWRRRDQTR